MSISGRKTRQQTVLSWEWWRSLDEYAHEYDVYHKGWHLNIDTAVVNIGIHNYGWPIKDRLLDYPKIKWGCLYLFGCEVGFAKPESMEMRYTGDAR